MPKRRPVQPALLLTLRVHPAGKERFEVCSDDGKILGTSQNEMMAIWTAVFAAEEISKSGSVVRVVSERAGREVEEFVATPPTKRLVDQQDLGASR
jgi:hypothetical protein